MVGHSRLLLKSGLGGHDAGMLVELLGIAVDDLPSQGLAQLDAEFGLADCSGADNENSEGSFHHLSLYYNIYYNGEAKGSYHSVMFCK